MRYPSPSTSSSIVRRWLVCALLALVSPAVAADPLPIALQAVLLKKVLGYDRTFEGKDAKVVVVFGSEPTEEVSEVVKQLKRAGLDTTALSSANFEKASGFTVAYVLATGLTPKLVEKCAAEKMLSVAQSANHVTSGQASLFLGKRSDGRPSITIHLGRSKTEGQDFSSSLLTLAEVIR